MNCLKSLGLSDHVDWKMNTSEKPRIQKTALKLVQKILFLIYCLSLYFFLKIWRNVRHGFARGYWAVQNVLAIQCQRPKPSFGRGTFTWRSSLAIGRYCQRRWGCLPQSESIYLLGCAALRAASIHVPYNLLFSFVFLPRYYDGSTVVFNQIRGHSVITLTFFAYFWPTKYPLVSLFTTYISIFLTN